ncbi:glycoside hydrolase family 16 protein [Patellaria atrata CBS 101060]|uniref:Crh-like protein n=1 Tax=Patellaria atrata CBS 101060 TaxID=1346257 RepID=A0A9P4VQE2_9PEZI|nr:glycoside hydrolase family 16 protein [Patellaria atrata CBS 101060]
MRTYFATAVGIVAIAAPLASTQTWSDCNPLKKTDCPNNKALDQDTRVHDFTTGKIGDWSVTNGKVDFGADGTEFTIHKTGESPTIRTPFYIFGGRVDITMKASKGTGIVSSLVLQSDDLDEIDWEFIGNKPNEVQTNYFSRGNTTTHDRGGFSAVQDFTKDSHTYSIEWTDTELNWIIDDVTVRTLKKEDAAGGKSYPQTPMNIRLGIWAGGDSPNAGTVKWAGGKTNYTQAPFTMSVSKVAITNYAPADEYRYGDQSGTWESIEILEDGGVDEGDDTETPDPGDEDDSEDDYDYTTCTEPTTTPVTQSTKSAETTRSAGTTKSADTTKSAQTTNKASESTPKPTGTTNTTTSKGTGASSRPTDTSSKPTWNTSKPTDNTSKPTGGYNHEHTESASESTDSTSSPPPEHPSHKYRRAYNRYNDPHPDIRNSYAYPRPS